MRESRTYGSVRGGHRKVLVYSIAFFEMNVIGDTSSSFRIVQ